MTAEDEGRAEGRARALLEDLFASALSAVSPERIMPSRIDRPARGRLAVVALGKAAGAMFDVVVDQVGGPLDAVVAAPPGHGPRSQALGDGVDVITAGHPTPNAESVRAADRALGLASSLVRDDALLVLVSGGGSALMAAPAPGLGLADKIAVNQALLRSGAPISDMNVVRRRLSRIKGGGLAAAAGEAMVTTLVISDIPGDEVSLVASGPTFPSSDAPDDALEIVRRYGLNLPSKVMEVLRRAPLGLPGLPPSAPREVVLLAAARDALTAAGRRAQRLGLTVVDLGDRLEGEARDLGARHAALALRREDAARVILSGGETSVTVRNPLGRGGRNLEYLLGLALALDGAPGIYALACDTDGVDGTETAAGAFIGPRTLRRALALSLDPRAMLAQNNAYLLFEALGDLVVTGPTRTNVNDFRAILVAPAAASG